MEKPKRIIDPDDYDLTLDIHHDPLRHPGTPYQYKDDEEFDSIHDAYYTCFMRKDRPKDYTEYIQALIGNWKVKGQDKKTIERKLGDLRNDGIKF